MNCIASEFGLPEPVILVNAAEFLPSSMKLMNWWARSGRGAVFFDHALIASLGCDSVLNLPVVHGECVLGTLNLLHEADWYGEEDIASGTLFAALAVPGYLALG